MSKTGVHRNNISKSLLMQVVILEILSLGFGYIFILFYEKGTELSKEVAFKQSQCDMFVGNNEL